MNILLGITGGISAFKAPSIASVLVSNGNNVKCVCTESALSFVAEIALSTMSKNDVIKNFDNENKGVVIHIELAKWCDKFVVAPCTANFIGKMANGIADDILSTIYMALPRDTSVGICPAMNPNMWQSRQVERNMEILCSEYDVLCLEPEVGKLACGGEGIGKLPTTCKIVEFIQGNEND